MDRAALDLALELGIRCGGWCPAGRWAEDGPIPAHYPLRETPSPDPAVRTAWNVRDSDATLLLIPRGTRSPGTQQTLAFCRAYRRPFLVVDPFGAPPPRLRAAVRRLCSHAGPERSWNVAGPRESEAPGVGCAAFHFLRRLLLATSTPGERPIANREDWRRGWNRNSLTGRFRPRAHLRAAASCMAFPPS